MEFLGVAVRSDRLSAGLSQERLENLLHQNAAKFGVVRPRMRLASGLERGIIREVSVEERRLLAFCLNQPENRYIGLETNPSRVIIDLLKRPARSELPVIERAIEFPPEYKQAGIGILSYFSEIVAKQYPDEDITVSIYQNGNRVTLRIETLDGDVEEIEKTLEEYGLVVSGQLPVDKFTQDRDLIRDLKMKLEIANLELRLRREAYLEQKENYDKRVTSLEDQVDNLHALVSAGLSHSMNLATLIEKTASAGPLNDNLKTSLRIIAKLSKTDHSVDRERQMNEALRAVGAEFPSFYSRLLRSWEAIPSSIAANMATPWVVHLLNSLPR